MTKIQAAVYRMLKAIGFPPWTGSTTSIPPGGWASLDWYGRYAKLMEVPAFVGCQRVLGGTIGSVPFHVFKEGPGGVREKFPEHAAYPILHDSPNRYMTSMELRQFLMLAYCLGGNGYAEITRVGNRICGLNPLQAERMNPKMTSEGLVYEYTYDDGKKEKFPPENIIHLKNSTSDGIKGLPHVPEQLLQRAILTSAYGAAFMRNQGRPSGVVESPGKPNKDPGFIDKWRADWAKLFSGENAGGTGILWEGATYKSISISPDDAQYIETMKQLNAEFSAIYGVPLNLLEQADKTATYASAEQFDLQYTKHCVRPLAVMVEQAFNKKLFPKEPNVYCELDLDGLQRGDSKAQAEYFGSMVDHGNLTNNEIRRKLNYPEVPEGNKLRCQANMVELDQLPRLSAVATSQTAPGDIRKELPAPHIHVSTPMAEEQMSRVVKEITTAAASSKNKKVLLLKTADGTTIGARIIEED